MYKHGIYGTFAETSEATSVSLDTIPAYIGSAPIHRINSALNPDFDYSEYINKPILISSLREARDMGLYSDDWKTYTLCEAIHAHFMNGFKSVAPIILVNTLDPETHVATEAGTASVTMKKVGKKYIGTIEDALCCLDSIALTVGEGSGVTLSNTTSRYNGDKVTIETEATAASGKTPATFIATATYSKIDFDNSDFTAESVQAALDCLDYCEQIVGVIPNILAAPAISEVPELHSIMVQKASDKIAGKWNFILVSDIPSSEETYAAAKAWKETNAYESKYDKVCWPALAYLDKVYHASTVVAYTMQSVDSENDNVPYVSVSNKDVFCDRAVVGDGEVLKISEASANDLNKVGITTVNIIKRSLRLWGSHMANYNDSIIENIAIEDRFDASVRMSMFILNYLQTQYINEIDESFTRKDVDSIVNGAQTWLDALVNDGMLLYATINFNNESNSDEDIANGDFVFDLRVTYTVIAKSITFKLQYTNEGLSVLTDDGGEE